MLNKNIKFKVLWSIALTLTLLIAPFSVAQGSSARLARLITPDSAEIIPHQYIIVFKSNFRVAGAENSIRTSVKALGGHVKFVYGKALNGYSAYLPAAALAAVRADPAVDYVEADTIIRLEPETEGFEAEGTQNSPVWGLDRINQRNLPLDAKYTYARNGAGVNVYVIDTGIRSTHNQFGGRASKDFDSVNDGQNGNDCAGHGTHVAGTIGGATFGVAKAVSLHAVRVLNCAGSGELSGVVAGIDWVATHRILPAVANLSLGGGANKTLDIAINRLIATKVTVVVAAGNSDANACNYSPARVVGAITVGATTSDDQRAYFSNWGPCLDIFAPGYRVRSAWNTSDTAVNVISGTSMAAPHVAGVAALYLQGHPTATAADVRTAIVKFATPNKVLDPELGSINRLLYSLIP